MGLPPHEKKRALELVEMEDLRTDAFLEDPPPAISLLAAGFGILLAALIWSIMLILVAMVLMGTGHARSTSDDAQHFVSKHGFDVTSTAGWVNKDQVDTFVDAFIAHAVQYIRHETVQQVVNLAPPAILFTARKIDCDEEGGCVGSFTPPGAIEVYLETPDCVAVSGLAHELSHWLLWQVAADRTHNDSRFFVQKDIAGRALSYEQRLMAVENLATWAACEAGCPWVCRVKT